KKPCPRTFSSVGACVHQAYAIYFGKAINLGSNSRTFLSFSPSSIYRIDDLWGASFGKHEGHHSEIHLFFRGMGALSNVLDCGTARTWRCVYRRWCQYWLLYFAGFEVGR